jgi:hypothetical protein
MLSSLAQGVRDARVAIGLTQEALAARLQLKARQLFRGGVRPAAAAGDRWPKSCTRILW